MPPGLISFKERPVINSQFLPSPETPAPRSFDLRTLMYWIKKTPECIGIGKRISNDIITNISFTAMESIKKPGRPATGQEQEKIDKAQFFAADNHFKIKATALSLDWIFTGDNYMWKGKLPDDKLRKMAKEHFKGFDIEFKEVDKYLDEDYNGISQIEILPSSMTHIKHDDLKIKSYVQRDQQSPGDFREFSTEQIIHGKFMDIDGSVYGYSPMEASYTAIRTVNAIQDYGWYYFENGAKLDRLWIYKGNPNPDYWKKLQEDVSQYISIKKTGGQIFAAGAEDIKTEKLNEISEDMEYRNLAIHSVGRLAFAFNMPADILSAILGKDIRPTAGSSDVEDAGYYRNIERAQEYLETIWNSQLWVPHFGVEMHFQRIFKQDQIRQLQYMAQAMPVAEFLQRNKFPLKEEYYYDLLQIDKSFLTKGKIQWTPEPTPGVPQQGKLKGPASQAQSDLKKQQQKPQSRNNPPLGV